MMTPEKEFTHAFMKWKASTLKIPELYSDMVKTWINKAEDKDLRKWIQILNSFPDDDDLNDSALCPFCVVYGYYDEPDVFARRKACMECKFGQVYGRCDAFDSLYDKTADIESYYVILSKKAEHGLVNKIEELYHEFFKNDCV